MWNTILGIAFTLFMAAFCAASCWLSWEKARARSGKPNGVEWKQIWHDFDAECDVSKAESEFAVDRGRGIEMVLWHSRRKSRPKVIGYGMTATEAVHDLTHHVQPLSQGVHAH